VESSHTLVQPSRDAGQPARRRIARSGAEPDAEAPVLGRYRLIERLGSGGFGVVWRAHDELLHREVAVKRVWLGAGGGPIDSERAGREALAAARLSHPAIVALYEACAVDDAFYLISELIDGDTLACLIAEQALEDEEVLEIGLALAGALAHAHARGVIHRDIKPHNVLVPARVDYGRAPGALVAAAKLTDFGGASLTGEDALTRTGDVLGTLAYMAPEQSEGREVGEQADLYSLALVLYEAFCGENPVRGATPAATVRRIGRRLAPLHSRRRDLPLALTRSLDRALAPAPADRGTLQELRVALEHALEHGLRRSRWPLARSRGPQRQPLDTPAVGVHQPTLARSALDADAAPDALAGPRVAHAAHPSSRDSVAHPSAEDDSRTVSPRIALPRAVWLACALAVIVWQAIAGHPGVALLALAALAPLLVLPGERRSSRLGAGWLACALAPALGLAGLAGAYPAIAGQASRWRERAGLGALGYWWLVLAEPLARSQSVGRLWLGAPAGTPARSVWEGSVTAAAAHVIAPLAVLGVLLGALLWGVGAALLPWLVRGRSAALDLVAVTVWSAALAAFAPVLDSGLNAGAAHPSPRGAIVGALLGGVIAVAARALRGPI
jgi:eukaryotic-like serine/threonine-protein kinase